MRKSALNKKKRFHPLRHQLMFVLIGELLLFILIIAFISGNFLEDFYIAKKTEVLTNAQEALHTLNVEDVIEWDQESSQKKEKAKIPDEISKESSLNNLSWVIINGENSGFFSWGENEKMLRSKLFGYIYDLDEDKSRSRILRETDTYVIQQVEDRYVGMDYVECWGVFDEDYFFLMRTPLESIRESVAISNTFYLGVGLIILIISGFAVMLITKKVTKPISELTELASRMSELDFGATYNSNAGNEIDLLGASFNKMSKQLQSTILELKAANYELQRDIEDKILLEEKRKEFLDNVSHELKTPIALVQGYAEGLKDNILEDVESREFYCDVIIDEATKMNKLVKNLLTLNQLESGQDTVVMEHFDIVALIYGVLQKMDIMIQQKEAKIIFEEEHPIYVWADEFRVEEVVTNYVSNALNHLEGEKQIVIRIYKEEKVKVTVFNNGKPIPEADLPNLWNKFYKVDKARTREYGGSGIGLSIVKAILQNMNQEYGVQNYENGVEFWFTLDWK